MENMDNNDHTLKTLLCTALKWKKVSKKMMKVVEVQLAYILS